MAMILSSLLSPLDNSIEVKKADAHCPMCFKCKRPVKSGTLIVVYTRCVHHLKCFKPSNNAPILIESQVKIDPLLSATEAEKVKNRFKRWNSQFVLEKVPEKFVGKCVKQVDLKRRRLLVEIFRFLSPGELEKLAALVCQEWYEVTREDEVWNHFLSSQFSLQSTDESPRTKFIACWLGGCWHCKRLVPLPEVFMRCPLMKRPLCTVCSNFPSLRIVDLPCFLQSKNIQISTGHLLNFPWFLYRHRPRCCYQGILRDRMKPYAERRLQLLVQGLENEGEQGLAALAKRFPIESFYDDSEYKLFTTVDRAVSVFCGKNEKRENFAQSYQACREALREALEIRNETTHFT